MDYKIYTTEFDETLNMSDVPVGFLGPRVREFAAVKRQIEQDMPQVDQFSGHIDIPSEGPNLVFLLDCSGSMNGAEMTAAVFTLLRAGDALYKAEREFEILGYTTQTFESGKARALWEESGKPPAPGRLSDLRHMIFKDIDEPWPEARDNLLYFLTHMIIKDEVTGEALEWARDRIQGRGGNEALVLLSMSGPRCDATDNEMGEAFLKCHYHQVMEGIVASDMPLVKLDSYPMHDIGDIGGMHPKFASHLYQYSQTINRAMVLICEKEPDGPDL
jgi:cobalamin biosynthesis protein CobT